MERLEVEEPSRKRRRIENLLRLSPESGNGITTNDEIEGNLESLTKNTLEKSDLSQRLQAFLPQMEEANSLLTSGKDVNLEVVDEDGEYIEMNLGLGVLEEKGSEEDESESDEDGNIFDKLMGHNTVAERKKLIQDYDPHAIDQVESTSDDSDISEATQESESEETSDSETSDEASTDEDEESELFDKVDDDEDNDMQPTLPKELDMNLPNQKSSPLPPGREAG